MAAGVTIVDPATAYIGADVTIGADTVIHPERLSRRAHARSGRGCEIHCRRPDRRLDDRRRRRRQQLLRDRRVARVDAARDVGPFAHIRPQSDVGEDAHVGNFVELKKTTLGRGSKANHLAYLGDATIGEKVNVGAGTITCNYDGDAQASDDHRRRRVHRQRLAADRAGPRRQGRVRRGRLVDHRRTCRPDALAIARGRQVNKDGWVAKTTKQRKSESLGRMCGIIGYIGAKQLVPILIDGLRRLEYRGYDSAGVAVVRERRDRAAAQRRQAGAARGGAREQPARGGVRHRPHALGDARPADRGERAPAPRLHRPHRRRPQRHHRELPRAEAAAAARRAHVRHRDRHRDRRAPGRARDEGRRARERGAARAALHARPVRAGADLGRRSQQDRHRPQRPADRRRPRATDEFFVASDIPAILSHTRDVVFLGDEEMAVITPSGVEFTDYAGRAVSKKSTRVSWDPVMAEKAGYKHFMLKEIFEQPWAVKETVLGRASVESGKVFLQEIEIPDDGAARGRAGRDSRVRHVVARGAGRQVPDRVAGARAGRGRLRIGVPLSRSDRRRRTRWRSSSRSRARRRTRWRRCARRRRRGRAASPSATSSAAWRRARPRARSTRTPGPEIGVASTKAFTSQLVALHLLAVYLGQIRGTLTPGRRRGRTSKALTQLPVLHRADAQVRAGHRGDRQAVLPAQRFPLSRARHQLSDRARRRAEAEGDLLHPRRGLSGRRDEARPDRAHRRGHAGRRDRAGRSRVREDDREHPGSEGARRVGDRADDRGHTTGSSELLDPAQRLPDHGARRRTRC